MVSDKIKRIRTIIETAMQSVDDRTASEAPTLFPRLKGDGSLISHGTRIQFNGSVYRAGSDLWDREDSTPEAAPALWEKLMYRDGIRIIPEVITTTAAFAKGEKGWWKGEVWVSLVDANVYTPDVVPGNWNKIGTKPEQERSA